MRKLALAGMILVHGCNGDGVGSSADAGLIGDSGGSSGMNILSLGSFNSGWSVGRCAYGATSVGACDTMVACDTSPIPGAGAGDITITDGSHEIVYRLQNGGYVTYDVEPGWVRNDLTISASGAEIPAFSLTTHDPVTLTVTAPAARTMHPVSEPLVVTWTGEPTNYQILVYGTHDGTGGRNTKSCLIDGAARTHTLTPEALAFLGPADDDVQICVQGIATSSMTSGRWLFEAWRRTSGICKNIRLVAP